MTKKFYSLLQDLVPFQVLSLLHEEAAINPSLKQSSYKEPIERLLNIELTQTIYPIHFFYVIDPYDLLEYCFPFGFKSQNTIPAKELDKMSDRQTAWDYFFKEQPFLILMDEHRNELGRNRNRLVRDMQSQIDEFDEFEKFVRNLYGQENLSELKIKELEEEIFNKRLSWLVSAGTGEMKNGPERFNTILKKMVIDGSGNSRPIFAAPFVKEDQMEYHHDTISNIFYNTKASQNSYQRYIKMLEKLRRNEAEVDDNREVNILVDCKVTDRILNINKQLEDKQKELNCRYFVLYLSSDNKSRFISKELYQDSPLIFGKPFSVMRNVAQIWLHYMMSVATDKVKKNSPNNEFSTVQNLLVAYNTLCYGTILKDQRIIKKITDLRERLEWHALIKNIAQFPKDLKKTFEELQNRSSFVPLRNAFGKLVETLKNTSVKDSLINFEAQIRNYSLQLTLLQKVVMIINQSITPEISLLGHVVGVNHHLPTLFKTSYSSKYQSMTEKIVNYILSPIKDSDLSEKLKKLAHQIKSVLIEDEVPDIQDINNDLNSQFEIDHYERQKMLYLFGLLLPSQNFILEDNVAFGQQNLDVDFDELLFRDLQYVKNKLSQLDPKFEQQRINNLYNIANDLFYIGIWSLRRNNKLDECAKLLYDAHSFAVENNKAEKDIRMIHGTALLSYSRLLEYIEISGIKTNDYFDRDALLRKYWKQAEKDVRRAVVDFEQRTSQDLFLDAYAYERAYSAVLNTLLYVYVLGYSMNKEISLLQKGRELLNNKISRFKEDRLRNPEYLHTESYLEFMEAKVLFKTDRNKARIKLIYSRTAIEKCLETYRKAFPNRKDDSDYLNLQKNIEDLAKIL